MRIVAIEEHWASPELLAAIGEDYSWAPKHEQVVEATAIRLAHMDAAGIDVQVLSFLPLAAQEPSVEVARLINDTCTGPSPPGQTGSPPSPPCRSAALKRQPPNSNAPSPSWAASAR
ncbi:hypothetical protein RKE30_16820 [Streptomyces sp. Li-HN-5-11]|uniref:hypothetical protein n=1 Tax=Streptomyces sp. Li-HN-5-11 TaxID=3075432 RepID=UPI0028A9976D|nr:hypothetical protein [Streptomyces sp. Li-HN-5-11]WNM31953.1 hypothetical protein RKE30_16820 [Streptomyces sp. Li-HN-5-11]